MSPKKILLTVLVAAGLAGASALSYWLQKPSQPSRPLAGLQAADVARIELDYNGEHAVLEKAGGSWRLAAPIQDEADAAAAEALSQGLRNLALGSEVSRESASHADYEVNESSAARVRVYSRASAAPVLDGFFGKPAMGATVYFRPSREATVYLAEGAPSDALRRGAQDLRSKALLPFSVGELTSLKFSGAGGFTLVKSSSSWTASGRQLSSEAAAEIVLSLASLRFTEFASAGAPLKTGFDKPVLDVVATAGARSERIRIGREDRGGRAAEVAGRKAVGFVAKPQTDSLLKLLKKPK